MPRFRIRVSRPLGVTLFGLALAAAALGEPLGSAEPIDLRIDLATQLGSTPGNWNNVSNLTGLTAGLVDYASGAATSVSIDGTGSPWESLEGDSDGEFPDQEWLIQPATVDGAGLDEGEIGLFTLTGLPDGVYRIEVVSARTTFGYLDTILVNGALADRTHLGTPVVTPWNATSDGLEAGNWLIWDGVVPVAGAVTIAAESDPATLGIVNALRVLETPYAAPVAQAIPTVSSLGLALLALALAGLALGRMRRRRAA